ncbi:MAG: PAS domain S-box protein [Candidatus Acidiferrales bacterium]
MNSKPALNSDLHQSEIEQFRMLVEQVQDYAIFMMDPQGRVATWNAGAERIKGYTASEIIGQPYATFFPPEDAAAGKPKQILEAAVREGRADTEGWRVRKDGSRFWASALVTAIRDRSGKLLGFSKVTRDITERMRYEEALRNEITAKDQAQQEVAQSEHALRELSFRLLQTQDEERRRIGREMHDSIGQYLSALKIKLGLMPTKYPALDEEARRELEMCAALLADCIKEVRTISYLLYPPMLEERGLKSAIDWYLDGFRKRSGLTVNFDVPERLERPSRDVELALFRVLQESVTNIHLHSGGSLIDIALSAQNGTIELKVRDYGKGLPQTPGRHGGNQSSGVGLRGMSERMLQLGGTLKVSSADPGTLVHATVPTHSHSKPPSSDF